MLCIFNPEHDLCLANGSPSYLPPQSALRLGDDCKGLMRTLYGDAECVSTTQIGSLGARWGELGSIVPWGWDAPLARRLAQAGAPPQMLPTQQQLADLRALQHRTTAQRCLQWMSQQTGSPYPAFALTSWQQLPPLLERYGRLVLKQPLSGSGRGVQWIRGEELHGDGQRARREALRHIVEKTVAQQGCIMAEPWMDILAEFAMEFEVGDEVRFTGYSLFAATAGVYAGNLLLPDSEIERRIATHIPPTQLRHTRLLLTYWLRQHIRPLYRGPLGVDMFVHATPRGARLRPVSEFNLRHTMGMVAHHYLQAHPHYEGRHLAIKHDAVGYHLQVIADATSH